MNNETVKVRVAVRVYPDGFVAIPEQQRSPLGTMVIRSGEAQQGPGYTAMHMTAELPIPQPTEVTAEVESA